MQLLDKLNARLRPTAAEKKAMRKTAGEVINALNLQLKSATAALGGSGAKGTWAAGSFDVDIFVSFSYEKYAERSDELADILAPVLRKALGRARRIHGSRDYFRLKKKGIMFEIVPILAVRTAARAKNITDVSPLHARWVKRRLTAAQTDDVRLLKEFCRAQRIYGAESYISGFSGYVCEILVFRYSSFLNVLRAAAKWKQQVIIDVENHYANAAAVLRELNRSKRGPLMIVDPVQKERNAAAAVSAASMETFRNAARKFLKAPSEEFFTKKEWTAAEMQQAGKGKKHVIIKLDPLESREDIAAAKALKAVRFVREKLVGLGFSVYATDWQWSPGSALAWIEVDAKNLPAHELRRGPAQSRKEHAARFRKAHGRVIAKNGRLYAKVQRPFVKAENAVRHLLRQPYMQDKVKRGQVL